MSNAATNGLMPRDRILPLLSGVVEDGPGKWRCYCPIHEADGGQHDPSLGITEKPDGRLLFYCFVCGPDVRQANFCYAVGLTEAELYAGLPSENGYAGRANKSGRGKSKARGKKVAEYIYRDSQGCISYRAERWEQPDGSKTFSQSRPNGQGGWVPGVRGVERVPYRLPELIASAATGETVFVVEGEKKAEALVKWGLVATCNVGGAGKWAKEFSTRWLRGRDVVILPDNDPIDPETGRSPGFDHAAKVLEFSKPVAKSVRVIELPGLPPKGDIVDWIDQGGTLPQLLELLAAAAGGGDVAAEAVLAAKRSEPVPTGNKIAPISVCNFEATEVETENGPKILREPISIVKIREIALKLTDGWPRRVGQELFFHSIEKKENEPAEHSVEWFKSEDSLFAFFGKKTGQPPEFERQKIGKYFHSRGEVHSHLMTDAQKYEAVESLPHEPPLADHYYACEVPASGDGTRLNQLVNKFSPETEIDRNLILAAFVTPFWGGAHGSRPAFCFTSDAGKGTGKSTLAYCISELAGGAIDVSANEEIANIKVRLLSPAGVSKRIVWIDNVKSYRLSWAELESLITSPIISGKKHYVGESSRPNTLTCILTMNGVSLSTDMAQRAVIIQLTKPVYSGTWSAETRAFVVAHRAELIADIMGFLRKPVAVLEKFSRWGDWERDVLARLPNPKETQSLVTERQVGVDVDAEESEMIEEYFAQQLASLSYSVISDRVFIPTAIASLWLIKAVGDKHMTLAKAARSFVQRVKEEHFQRISICLNRNHGRGYYFLGDEATEADHPQLDLENRIEQKKGERNNF